MYGTKRTTPYGYSIWETRFCGSVQGPDATNDPVISASVSPLSGVRPLNVSFDASATTDPNGNTLSYLWTYGDGSAQGNSSVVSHTYNTGGEQEVVLTVADNNGGFAQSYYTVSVLGRPSCTDQNITNASASSEGTPLNEGYDNNSATYWASAGAGVEWAIFDLGSEKHVEEITIEWVYGNVDSYNIE